MSVVATFTTARHAGTHRSLIYTYLHQLLRRHLG